MHSSITKHFDAYRSTTLRLGKLLTPKRSKSAQYNTAAMWVKLLSEFKDKPPTAWKIFLQNIYLSKDWPKDTKISPKPYCKKTNNISEKWPAKL